MSDLASMPCEACKKGAPPATPDEQAGWLPGLAGWAVVSIDGIQRLQKTYRFADFKAALEFTVRVGNAAETDNHHPALLTEWGRVTVSWWTHKIGGLHRNDFVMAARTDRLFDSHQEPHLLKPG